jgi:hypothetical protein
MNMSLRALPTVRTVGALFLTLTAARPGVASPSAPADSEVLFVRLLDAIKARSFDDFLGVGNAHFKSHVGREQFEWVCNNYTQRLRNGYNFEYLGHIRKRDATEQIWRLSTRDDEVETMLNLVMKDGKLEGLRIF